MFLFLISSTVYYSVNVFSVGTDILTSIWGLYLAILCWVTGI